MFKAFIERDVRMMDYSLVLLSDTRGGEPCTFTLTPEKWQIGAEAPLAEAVTLDGERHLTGDVIQAIIDAAYAAGFRASDEKMGQPAKDAHLADMRRLVFDHLIDRKGPA